MNYIDDLKLEGLRIRGKCNWYEDGEKSSKFFLNLEKDWAIQNQIRLLKIGEKEINDQSEILQNLYQFYEELYSKKFLIQMKLIDHYLKDTNKPKLTKEQSKQWEGEIIEN